MQLNNMPLKAADYRIVAVSSMEQIIGGALASVIGVMLPMMQMLMHHDLPSLLQGIIGAMGLIGIGFGSVILGSVSDHRGYLFTFRLCPIIIIVGSAICYFVTNVPGLIIGLLTIGIGVGGGYSLDSAYISELLPEKWRMFMVGVAKATCSFGFVGASAFCAIMLHLNPTPQSWHNMILIVAALGLITLLLRIRWWESPKWLLIKGRIAEAQQCTQKFLGKDVTIDSNADKPTDPSKVKIKFVFKDNIDKIIFSGIPWACEGLAVYGFTVFLPALVLALGIGDQSATGIHKIMGSVEMSAVVNFFMLPGFIIGLCIVRKIKNVKMLYTGFFFAALGLVLLLIAYEMHWPVMWLIAGFIIFEVALNAGPHLLTFIIPQRIYQVAERGEGGGIAALMGKVGAVAGVILMPVLLDVGGMRLVLIVSAAVMLLGAVIGRYYGKKLNLLSTKP